MTFSRDVKSMVRQYDSAENVARAIIRHMIEDGGYSSKTIAHAREHMALVIKNYLGDRSLYTFGPEDMRQILNSMVNSGLAVATQKSYIFAIRSLLRFIGNPASETPVIFQADIRPCVDWLTPDQAQQILNHPLPPNQRLAVVLCLCMGLRKVELIRLRLQDIDQSKEYISVTGKGRAGGKLRLVPFHERFNGALQEYLITREELANRSKGPVPDNLFIWYDRQARQSRPYNAVKASGMDGLIRRASVACSVHFSAHTLRRTFGRLMWLSGVPVVVIARILGHSSTEQTLQYIGANLDDMAGAMSAFMLK